MRVLLAGATLKDDWVGGEPEVARLLSLGLTHAGHEVRRVALARERGALASMALVPLDTDPVAERRYRGVLDDTRPDVVLAFYDYDTSLVRVCKRSGVPVVVCAHVFWPTCPIGVMYIDGQGTCDGARVGKCLRHMMFSVPDARLPLPFRSLPFPLALQVYAKFLTRSTTLNAADAIVVPSQSMRKMLESDGIRGIQVVPNAVDSSQFSPRRSENTDQRVLFPAGHTAERKGLRHFITIARELKSAFPDVEFVATNYRGDDVVTGRSYLARRDYLRLMEGSAVIVVPTLWEEPFGMVALEAMAAGVPVAAYASGAIPEIILDGTTGILAPTGDVRALSRAVRTLLGSRALSESFGQAGRERAERYFDFETMTQRYLRVIRSVTPTS
ncbi:MAG TPA: glycosyltransferase family 4 protein [Thermoplasmata archaeon]